MKNLFTNLMKNTAKRAQNTGGGASQSQTSRSEGARQITARFESAQMKNTSLISGCSTVDVPMPSYGAPDEHPMSIRSASDERRWNSRVWKYVACMLIAFFVGVGNVWAATSTNPATVTFAGKTFLNVAATDANARIKNADSTLAYNVKYLQSQSFAWVEKVSDGGSTSTSSTSGLVDAGFLPHGSNNAGDSDNSAEYTALNKIRSDRPMIYYVTGITSVGMVAKGADNKSNKWIGIKVEEVTYPDNTLTLTTVASAENNRNYTSSCAMTIVNSFETGMSISGDKFYKITILGGTTTAVTLWQVRFGKYVAPACSAPAAPSISGTTSYTAGNTITLTATCASGADASTTYTWYKGADWATASAASAVQAAATGSSGYTFTKSAVVADAGTYWCEASNGSGCEAHKTTGYTITVTCATAPVAVTSLTCSEQTSSSLTYTWTKASNASGYVATLYPDEDCEDTPVATETLGDVATVTFNTSLSASTTYYCKVQSKGNGTVYCEDGGTTSAVSGTTSDPTYTVSATVNPEGYGSLSATSISSIVSGTEISTSDNVLTVDESSITATAADATTQYSYAFDSWTKSDGTVLPSTVTGDLAVRANFTRMGKSYTITLNDQGATNTPTGSVSATFGSAMPAIATLPTKTSYTLGGFYSVVGGGGTCYYNSSGVSQQNSDFEAAGTLYAKWTQSITLDDESATTAVSPSSVTATYNSSTIASITNPQKTGYSFGGWYTGDNGTGTLVINTSGVLQANVDGYTGAGGVWTSASARTLYAKWYPIETYTFNCSNSKSISTLKGEGWTFNSDEFDATPTDGEAYVNLVSAMNEEELTAPKLNSMNDYSLAFAKTTSAYARFDLGQTTTVTSVTGSMCVGTTGDFNVTVKYLGSDGSTVKYTYTKAHSKTNWGANALSYTTSVADVKYIQIEGGSKWQVLDNLSIEYVNKLVKYDVTYKANGGTGDDIEHNVATVEACTFTAPSNKHFTGWNTDAEGEGTAYAVGASVPSDLTLYAQWAWDTYTISFAAAPEGAGTVSSSSIASVEYGSEISINGSTQVLTLNETDITPTPADATAEYTYSLGTWNVTDGDAVTGTATYTHTFTRTANNYTLAWDKNGSGDALSGTYNSGTTAFNSSITAPNDPTWSGYRFDRWNSKDDGSGDDYTGEMPAANTTYYAQWTALYSVTHTLTGCTATSGDTGSGAAANSEAYEAVFSPSVGYTTPATVSVTIGGNDATVDEDYTWIEGTGTLSIEAASVTGAIVITVEYTEDNTERTVTYDDNEANSGTVPTEDDHKAGSTFMIKDNTGSLVKDGYTFRGWTYDGTFYTAGDTFTMPASAVTLTAVWDPGDPDPTTLVSIDFTESGWSSLNNTETAQTLTIGTQTVYVRANNTGNLPSVNTSTGTLTWGNRNFSNRDCYLAIPVTGVDGALTISVANGSSDTRFTYASSTSSTVSNPSSVASSTSANPSTVTLSNLSGTFYMIYLGRQGSTLVNATSITITTPVADTHFNVAYKDGNKTPESHTTWPDDIAGVPNGKKVLQPTDPEAEHYTFDGWYSNAACTAENEINWNTMTITADKTIYAKWLADTRITTQPQTTVDGLTNVAYTLGTGMVDVGENLSYQWYSYTSLDGAGEDAIEGKTSATMTDTKTTAGTYYYKVKVSGDYGDDASDMITVTVVDPCFRATDLRKVESTGDGKTKWSDITVNNTVISQNNVLGTITGGTLTVTALSTSESKLSNNGTGGLVFDPGCEITVTLSSGSFAAGTVISLGTYDANSSSTVSGLAVSGNACTPATHTSTSTTPESMPQSYTVKANDGIVGTNSFTISLAEGASKGYLKTLTVTGCADCTPISPTLTYSTSTLYVDPAPTTATATLTGYYGTPTISYASSNTSVATVNASTGEVAAVAAGTATITATIGETTVSTTDYCGAVAEAVITVAGCSVQEIAGVTLTSTTSADEDNATLIKNSLQDLSPGYKLNGNGAKFGMTLSGDAPFRVGDIIQITGTMDENPTVTDFAVYSGETAGSSSLLYHTTLSASATIDVEIEVTEDNLTALNTSKKVVVVRSTGSGEGEYNQNPHMTGMYLKRYSCSEGLAEFTGDGDDTLWSTTENWAGGKVPTIDDRIVINKPMTVDIAHAAAAEVILDQNGNTGKLTIEPNMGLEVAGTVQVYNGSSYGPTTPADLVLESSDDGNASLIFNNSNECQATVQMYSIGDIDGDTWNWQFMGTPFTSANALYSYYGSYLYEWNAGGYWDAVANGGTMEAFKGYCITQDAPAMYVMGGTLNPTSSDKEITIPANKEFVMANSWSAPISVCNFTETTLPLTDKTIYLFNTGHNESGATEGTAAGTYVAMPINSAIYTGNYLIAPMEGFYVDNTSGSEATITLKYDELVRPSGSHTDIVAGPMHAPRRVAATEEPAVMKLKATGSRYSERVVILEREDFSAGFDNGWDGKNLNEPGVAPILYTLREDGTKDAVSAIPTYEGTVVGFRNGEDNFYTFSFEYDGEDNWYLNDLKEQKSTLINAAETYEFVAEPGDTEARFVISATPIHKIATGNESAGAEAAKVRKLFIDDKVYIIRGGRMYSVDGQMIK